MSKTKNADLIEDYRNVIANEILGNEVIVDVLGKGEISPEDTDVLIWSRLFPNQFDPYTITETESYIFYDIDENVSAVNGYVTLTLYFWVVTHRNIVKYNGNIPESKNRLRNDIIARELKKLFAPKRNLGISRNKLMYNRIYTQNNNNYTARVLAFQITDFSDKIRYTAEGEEWW